MNSVVRLPFFFMSIFYLFLFFGLIICGIYGFVLFVKLARRGIKALDIYIDKNENNFNSNNKFKEDNIQ